MKRLVLAGLALPFCAVAALAQSVTTTTPAVPQRGTVVAPAPMTGTTNPAMTNPAMTGAAQTSMGEAVAGANSFTENQARSRLEKNGFSQVSGLAKGNDGIWRGSAMKGGSSVQVGVDFKGNISTN